MLFPSVTGRNIPCIACTFTFVAFVNTLGSEFHSMTSIFGQPLPLVLVLLVLRILKPITTYNLKRLLFPNGVGCVAKVILRFSMPTTIVDLV